MFGFHSVSLRPSPATQWRTLEHPWICLLLLWVIIHCSPWMTGEMRALTFGSVLSSPLLRSVYQSPDPFFPHLNPSTCCSSSSWTWSGHSPFSRSVPMCMSFFPFLEILRWDIFGLSHLSKLLQTRSVLFYYSSFFSNQCPRWGLCRATTCVQIPGYQTEEKEKAQISGKRNYSPIYYGIRLVNSIHSSEK